MAEALFWGLLGASSLVLGAVVVSVHMPSAEALGLIMGFGSGVLISAVSFELVEEAANVADGAGATAIGFFVGMAVFLLGDQAISNMGYRHRKRMDAVHSTSGLAIVLGTVLDGVPESAVLGLTVLESGTIGVAVLVAVFLSNFQSRLPRPAASARVDGVGAACMACGRCRAYEYGGRLVGATTTIGFAASFAISWMS